MHSGRIKGKRRRLIEKDPHCHFCGKEVTFDDSGLFTIKESDKKFKVLSCLECIYVRRTPLFSETSKNQKRRQKLIEENPHCYFCNRIVDIYTSTLDHLMPRSKGGRNSLDNIVLSCYMCNHKKGSKTAEEFKNSVTTSIQSS